MTREELATYDGRDGRPAYVAVNGTVYDFTDSELWRGGNHPDLPYAGTDPGAELFQAPPVPAAGGGEDLVAARVRRGGRGHRQHATNHWQAANLHRAQQLGVSGRVPERVGGAPEEEER